VKSTIPEEKDVSVMQIFKSSTPYWIIILICMVMIAIFPQIATYLPKLVF
jgi:TRAP-type mannitol/chloroaromatic compound transport system permease large subunit